MDDQGTNREGGERMKTQAICLLHMAIFFADFCAGVLALQAGQTVIGIVLLLIAGFLYIRYLRKNNFPTT
jgi:hypothetical protein